MAEILYLVLLFVLVWVAAFLGYPFVRDAIYRARHRAWWRRDAKP